ncbi:MAG TPA: hypothetical protein VMB84_03615 [Stellaceae bacterium]|nr:hypothetical protein [Stellaceae bacterium]
MTRLYWSADETGSLTDPDSWSLHRPGGPHPATLSSQENYSITFADTDGYVTAGSFAAHSLTLHDDNIQADGLPYPGYLSIGSISGSGSVFIGSHAAVDVGAASKGITFQFQDVTTNTLYLDPADFHATIADFQIGNDIDVAANIESAAIRTSGDTSKIVLHEQGGGTYRLKLIGDYQGYGLDLEQKDGSTQITLSAPWHGNAATQAASLEDTVVGFDDARPGAAYAAQGGLDPAPGHAGSMTDATMFGHGGILPLLPVLARFDPGFAG